MTIQIEEGKFYKRADGSIHGPAEPVDGARLYVWQCGPSPGDRYTADGRYYHDQTTAHHLDLIEEMANPAPVASTIWIPKVGDRVKSKPVPEAGIGIVTEILDGGNMRVDYKDTWYGKCNESILDIEPADRVDTVIEAAVAATAEKYDIKATIADEAKRIVSGARRSAYGKPEQNFERIARFWQAYFENTGRGDVKITAADVSPLMRLMKEARLAESPNHYDSFVDLIGYTLTGAEVNGVSKPT